MQAPDASAERLAVALERADRVVGEFEVVAAASQEPERPLAVAVALRRPPDTRAQDRNGRGQLVMAVAGADRSRRDGGLDAERQQPALDPVGPPGVEAAAVLGEAAGEARVVEGGEGVGLRRRPAGGPPPAPPAPPGAAPPRPPA